jgi:DNA-binding IclR family transcriptional regulator
VARPSPTTDRVVAVLSFLAQHPDERFTLSQLVEALGMNAATAHAMLSALVEARFLLRHPRDKSYALGPAMVQIGAAAAARSTAILPYATEEMERVARDIQRQCLATAIVGHELVILAATGPPGPMGLTVSVGHRFPFAPPIGAVFLASASDVEIRDWLMNDQTEGGSKPVNLFYEAVRSVRKRGYSVGLSDAFSQRRLMDSLRVAGTPPAPADGDVPSLLHRIAEQYIAKDLRSNRVYLANHVAAPIFASDGTVVLALHVIYFGDTVTGARLEGDASILLDAAQRVTSAIHGVAPPGWPSAPRLGRARRPSV